MKVTNVTSTSNLVEILRINGAFGVCGFLRAVLFSDNIKRYKKIYNYHGDAFSFRVVRFIYGNNIVLSLDGVSDRNAAEALKGTIFCVQKADLPPLSDSEFYLCDLIAKPVKIIGRDDIGGTVVSMHNFGAGDLLEISCDGDTFFVPFTRENFPDNPDDGVTISMTEDAFNRYKN
ncbi:MAG: ribosome maturation factor RimM [Holosporaceae bacterium]|jgi:16S rRNA processing protein RimM|nr:ribosome maturation factor RimM [Holosporaceae bacterium]